jgi:hypothetical protein
MGDNASTASEAGVRGRSGGRSEWGSNGIVGDGIGCLSWLFLFTSLMSEETFLWSCIT